MKKNYYEYICAIALVLWGLVVLYPNGTFESSDVFHAMMRIASEGVWSSIILAVGLFQIFGILCKKSTVRLVSSVLNLLAFITLFILLSLGSLRSTAFVIYLSMCSTSWFVFMDVLEDWKEERGNII